jgi:hypothetical protein
VGLFGGDSILGQLSPFFWGQDRPLAIYDHCDSSPQSVRLPRRKVFPETFNSQTTNRTDVGGRQFGSDSEETYGDSGMESVRWKRYGNTAPVPCVTIGPFSTRVTPHGFLRRSVLLPTGHLRLRSEPVPLHSPHFVFAGKEDVPREFTTTSRVIMIAKDWQTLSPG